MVLRKKYVLVTVIVIFIAGFSLWQKSNPLVLEEKEYKTGTETVIVVDTLKNKETAAIDLSAKEGDFTIAFNPHDITIIPNKEQVWVTATAPEEQFSALHREAAEHIHVMVPSDQVLVINTETSKITKRINVGMQLGLADLILTPDGKQVFVAAEKGNAIYKINTSTYKVDLIQLPPESTPHQLALSVDGTKLYARNKANNKLYFISTKTGAVKNQEATEETRNLNWSGH